MADGFEENVEFFTLTYESACGVAQPGVREDRSAPVAARRLPGTADRRDLAGWDVAEAYGVIADLDSAKQFLKAVGRQDDVTHRVHCHRRGPRCSRRWCGGCPSASSRSALRGVPANFGSKRGGLPVKFTLKDYQRAVATCSPASNARKRQRARQRRRPSFSLVGHDWRGQDGDGRGGVRGAVLWQR